MCRLGIKPPPNTSGTRLSVDGILKPFPATSAWFHTQHCLNYMLGLRMARQQPESNRRLIRRAFVD